VCGGQGPSKDYRATDDDDDDVSLLACYMNILHFNLKQYHRFTKDIKIFVALILKQEVHARHQFLAVNA
jgi:hypothetical protein